MIELPLLYLGPAQQKIPFFRAQPETLSLGSSQAYRDEFLWELVSVEA